MTPLDTSPFCTPVPSETSNPAGRKKEPAMTSTNTCIQGVSEQKETGAENKPKEEVMSTTPQRFTKRPVTIEAMQYDEHYPVAVIEWIRENGGSAWLEMRIVTATRPAVIGISTLEGVMSAQPGDWIIRGIQGEFYPCKPDIFEATYQPAAEHVEGEQTAPTDAEVQAAARAILDAQIARGGALPEAVVRWEHKADARAALVAAREVARHE